MKSFIGIKLLGTALAVSLFYTIPLQASDHHDQHDQHHEQPKGHAPAVANAAAAAKHDSGPKVAPDQAYTWLKNGNFRFLSGKLRKDGQTKKDIERLSKGQAPHTIVLSCSDSRVPPELVFDQKLGEVFSIRTAGESLDAMAIASIEYAVSHLGAGLILVLGHTSCGAVKAAISTMNGDSAGSEHLDKLVGDIQPRLKKMSERNRQMASKFQNVLAESWANTVGVAQDLPKRSKILQDKIADGTLVIKTGMYHLEDGHVEWGD